MRMNGADAASNHTRCRGAVRRTAASAATVTIPTTVIDIIPRIPAGSWDLRWDRTAQGPLPVG
ncbi:hypothetical protein Cde04nite_06840 [Cellulomonas denverensis]|nr:hypothetical protein Cde04nite_06840 [Cellulomonas denverensis]